MRCQYCGKRLPLFRKLKDGEFCSAAHREQFLGQSDQLAVAALREQRERTMRATRQVPVAGPADLPVEKIVRVQVPELVRVAGIRGEGSERSHEASFCHRYLVSTLAALPLGQLARVPLEPMKVRPQFLRPERIATTGWTTRSWISGGSLSADQVLLALNNCGAPSSARSALPVAAVDVPAFVEFVWPLQRVPGLMAGNLVELEFSPADFGETVALRPAISGPLTATTPSLCLPRLRLEIVPDAPWVTDEESGLVEATPIASPTPMAQLVPFAPTAKLLGGSGTPELGRRWGASGLTSPALWRPFAGFPVADLESGDCAQVAPIALHAPFAMVGTRVRFPALALVVSTMAVRLRAALKPAESADTVRLLKVLAPQDVGTLSAGMGAAIIPVLTPQILLAEAHAGFAERLQITGDLSDLLPPPVELPVLEAVALARRCRIAWRFEAQNVTAIRTLAIRHLAMDVKMRLPARPTVGVGPRRANQQLRLNAVLRPARFEFAAGSESVSFHLEPKVVQPRLRVRPDPARQGGAARIKGRNHADAAVSSIKIPVLRRFWAHAPADIRWVALIIPVVFFLAWYSWTPNGQALNKQAERADLAVDTSGVQTFFASFKSRISRRAAVELSEDFRTGLADWQGSRQDWAENWSYDQAGFIRPGNLALFTPTVGLSDYNFEFLGQIENRALSWVYRAKDARNYYLGRLVITRGGPVPEVSLVRSAVTNGRESKQRLTVLTMNLRTDTIYRVRVDVNGSDFTTSVLGQVVDTFTDGSHPQGGIGFYGGRGETSRIRWVEVSHQYDTLGRLCAMLVPYGLPGASVPVKADGPGTF